jgi:hypothetical protein
MTVILIASVAESMQKGEASGSVAIENIRAFLKSEGVMRLPDGYNKHVHQLFGLPASVHRFHFLVSQKICLFADCLSSEWKMVVQVNRLDNGVDLAER